MSGSSVRLCWRIFPSLLVICVSKILCGIHARYVKCDCDRGDDNDVRVQTTGLSNFVPKALSYSSSAEREGTLETRFRFFPGQYSKFLLDTLIKVIIIIITIPFRRIWAGAVCSYHRIGWRTTPSFGWNHQLLCVGYISDDNSPVCLLHSRLEASQYCTVRTGFTILVFLVVRQIWELKQQSF